MHNTNRHGPKRAILYARVSTDEQARTGFSLRQQIERLREYAASEGYEVLEEVTDPGQSGASLERPGMDRVRDLVSAGGVSVVLAQDRDRFSREPAYTYLLKREFEEHGTQLRSLNDRGDDSPEGQLTDGILDQLAKFERAKTAERTRRGKLRKAREGKVIGSRSPRYGFELNEARDGYEVEEEKMAVVRRIFERAANGATFRQMKLTFEQEGIPTPKGARFWDRSFFRGCILDDIYKPHTYPEAAAAVGDEIVARLDPNKSYGLWWFNKRRMIGRQVSEVSEEGRNYGKKYTSFAKPKEEWIAVPVPGSEATGIAREIVDAAREAIQDNRAPSSAGERFWQLSGGVGVCEECGRRLRTLHRTKQRKSGPRSYGYYRCAAYSNNGVEGCDNRRMVSASTLEAKAWRFVRAVMLDPEELVSDLDRMIELKRGAQRGDPEKEAKAFLEELAKLERMADGYHDQAAEGLMSLDKLREKLSGLDERREALKRELETIRSRTEELLKLETDRDAIVEYYATLAPEALDSLTPEECHRLYKMLSLKVLLGRNGEAYAEMPIRRRTNLDASRSVYQSVVTSKFARTDARS